VKTKVNLIIFFVVFAGISCEKDANTGKVPQFRQKLVVTSFISPRDSVSFVTIESNERLYGDLRNLEPLGKVKVSISDGTEKIDLQKGNNQFYFRKKDMAVGAGKTYHLEVTSENGLKADAHCSVPLQRDLEIKADTISVHHSYPDGVSWSELRIKVFLDDPPGENNYYCAEAQMLDYNKNYGGYPYITDLYNGNEKWFSDEGNDGKRIYANEFSTQYHPSNSDSVKTVIYILNTDKEYFNYHQSLGKYAGGEDPFTEVSPVFSNINGGLGIFAAFTVDSLIIRLE
jgi:hypothetical protein